MNTLKRVEERNLKKKTYRYKLDRTNKGHERASTVG